MSRLIHLNGPPGIGKSTLARRYIEEHPGVLNCDVDVLRTLIGGWERDWAHVGGLVRPAALAMIEAYLRTEHDVVFPQMLVDPAELARFEGAAARAGAVFVERFLTDTEESAVARFHRRGAGDADPWHDRVRAVVAAEGGDPVLVGYHAGLERLRSARPDAVVVESREGELDETYRALVATLG
jgi:predicted kinase